MPPQQKREVVGPEGARVQLPDGQYKTYLPGTDYDIIAADYNKIKQQQVNAPPSLAKALGPDPAAAGPNVNSNTDIGSLNSGQFGNLMLDLGMLGTSMVPGGGLAMGAARTGGSALLGAVKGALNAPPGQGLAGAGEGALDYGTMQGAGEGLASLLPKAGYATAIGMGGFGRNMSEKSKAIAAFIRQSQKANPGSRIPVGAQGRTAATITRGGDELARRLGHIQGEVPLLDFEGATDELRTKLGAAPSEVANSAIGAERGMIRSNALAIDARQNHPTGLITPRTQPPTKQELDQMIQDAGLNATDLQQIKLDTARQGRNVIEARSAGQLVTPSEEAGGQAQAALSGRARELQEGLAAGQKVPSGPPRGVGSRVLQAIGMRPPTIDADIHGLNKQLSDLFTMQDANKQLTGGGGITPSLMQGGMRFGIGSALGYKGSQATGMGDPATTSIISGLAALGLLNPRMISTLGNVSGRGAEYFPSIEHAFEVKKDLTKTKRKEPKK